MKTQDAEALWNEVVLAVRMNGEVPLHCAVAWTPERLASSWKQLNNNLLRGVLTKLSLQTVFALDLVDRVVWNVALRDPDDATAARHLIAAVERAVGEPPGTVDLKPVREQLEKLRSAALREMILELTWWIQAPEAYPAHHLPIILERVAANELNTTSRELLLSFGPPTIEQIVGAAQALASAQG